MVLVPASRSGGGGTHDRRRGRQRCDRRRVEIHLERSGWSVISTGDPDAVADLVGRHMPSAVLVDLHLGDRSGLDLAMLLEQTNPQLIGSIAMMTSDRNADLGGRRVLYKPFWAEDIDAFLRGLIVGHVEPSSQPSRVEA